MKQKLTDLATDFKNRFQPQIDQLILRLQPISDYWKRQTERDQQILIVVGVLIILMCMAYVVSGAIQYRNDLQQKVVLYERYKIYSEIYARQYKDLTHITPNDFSTVSSERIKNDAKTVLGIKNTTVLLSDGTLTIKADNVKFEVLMEFLDQLRKSYGLFPNSLKITRVISGYVSFNVVFNNVEQ